MGLDESSSRARISRYELGVHEPPVATTRLIAEALRVPLPYLYCDEDEVAALLLALFEASRSVRREKKGKDVLEDALANVTNRGSNSPRGFM